MKKNKSSKSNWDNWKWQMSNSITSIEDLKNWINISKSEINAIEDTKELYRWRVTPYYASLMDKDDPKCPIRQQALPNGLEISDSLDSDIDPVGDMKYRVTNRVVHKYPDRVILLVTQNCPVYCRHCTRKYHTTNKNGSYFENGEGVSFEEDISYIKKNNNIRDVLLTGGDPLTYSDKKLETVISRLRQIKHIEIIRIGTRYPVLLPQRITNDLCRMLKKYHPIWLSTHFNHPKELTNEAKKACQKLVNSGIPVLNQTVLMKGVNDEIEIMKELMKSLVSNRIQPYYLYHCDNVTGVSHFRTTIEHGQRIIAGLNGFISGFAVPKYILTTNLGKIPIEKSSIIKKDKSKIVLENYEGKIIKFNRIQ